MTEACMDGTVRNSDATVIVLHFGDPAVRGTEVCLRDTVDSLHEKGCRVALVANHPHVVVPLFASEPEIIISLEFPAVLVEQRDFWAPAQYWIAIWKLWWRLRHEAPALVLASGGLPCQLGLPLARLLGVRIICHFHHPATRRYFYGWLIRWVDAVFCPSVATQRSAEAGGCSGVQIVPNGVHLVKPPAPLEKDPSWREALNIAPTAFVALQVGALVTNKRPDVLVEAIAALARSDIDGHAVFIGEGPLRTTLAHLASELEVQNRVHLLGRVPEVSPYLRHVADVHTLLSDIEGFGIVVIEAAAHGLPNLVSVPSAMEEILRDGIDGFHVDGADPDSVAGALVQLVNDPRMRSRMGASAREMVQRTYAIDVYKAEIVRIVTENLVPGRGNVA